MISQQTDATAVSRAEAMQQYTRPLRVLIADDHSLLRESLAQVIRSNSDHVVLAADSFRSVQDIVTKQGPIDVLLLDVYMPDMEGLKSIEKAVAMPGIKAVALLSGSAPRNIVMQALALGAKGYIPKAMHLDSLMNALNFIATGETYLPVSLLGDEPRTVLQEGEEGDKNSLSGGEAEVLRLVVEGLPNKEIARRCGMTEIRVKMYMRMICRKLGVTNRTGAALRARELSLF